MQLRSFFCLATVSGSYLGAFFSLSFYTCFSCTYIKMSTLFFFYIHTRYTATQIFCCILSQFPVHFWRAFLPKKNKISLSLAILLQIRPLPVRFNSSFFIAFLSKGKILDSIFNQKVQSWPLSKFGQPQKLRAKRLNMQRQQRFGDGVLLSGSGLR